MLTRCPNCLTWFRVRAEHLSVAGGQVTCGSCETIFDALAALIEDGAPRPAARVPLQGAVPAMDAGPEAAPDEGGAAPPIASVATEVASAGAPASVPDAAAVAAAPVAVEAPAAAEPDAAALAAIDEPSPTVAVLAQAPVVLETGNVPAEMPAQPESLRIAEPAAAVDGDDAFADADWLAEFATSITDRGQQWAPTATGRDEVAAQAPAASWSEPVAAAELPERMSLPIHTLSADEHAILFTTPGSDDDEREDTIPEARDVAVPAVLASDLAALAGRAERGRLSHYLWPAASGVLALTLLAQAAWVFRERIAAVLPVTASLYAYACARLDCGPRDSLPPAVRLIARDVREHPQFRGALLVNATMINDAATPQPFPIIELRLHDASGAVLGARAFTPAEYLDQSIPVADGMPSARPVYVVMELGGEAAGAVSFEFTFM